MKLPNIYLILLAMTLVMAVAFSRNPRKQETTHKMPIRVVCW